MTQHRVARGSGQHKAHQNTQPKELQHRDGNFLVTEVTDADGSHSIIEDLGDEVCTRKTQPIPVMDMYALADLSIWIQGEPSK